MFILDILLYVFFACFMSNMAKQSVILFPNSKGWDRFLILFVLFYTLICALRWNVGVDSAGYALMFEKGITRNFSEINGEYLFYGLVELLSKLDFHFVIGMGICAFVQIFPIAGILKEHKYILVTLPFVLFGSRYFLDLNNGVRQMIVASFFIYSSRYIVDRKIIYYLFFILISSFIHHSAYMLLPFYFIPNSLAMANKRKVMLVVFVICFIAGMTPTFQSLVSYVEIFANTFGYQVYAQRLETLMIDGRTTEALSFGPMMLSYLLLSLWVIIYGPYLYKRYANIIPYFNLWYNFSFFYACAYFLICNVSHIFIRPVQYFELFQLIVISLLLYDLRYSALRNQLYYLLLIVIVWVNISWNIFKLDGKTWESVTYKTVFMHQDQVDKFINYNQK